jgi:tRNA pseudouridine55 synthase
MNYFHNKDIWLNIYKPPLITSARVVSIVKRLTKAKKVGHGGTLDPFATGVLPIALNKATKTSQEMMNATKKYIFKIKWGEFRDTDDIEGVVTERSEARPSSNDLICSALSFVGQIEQTPSKFSAIKIDGQRAYELARKNIDFSIPSRIVNIYSLNILFNSKDYALFEVECSKGTYIRSLARDICLKNNVCGYVSCLKRTRVGKFDIDATISLDLLKYGHY